MDRLWPRMGLCILLARLSGAALAGSNRSEGAGGVEAPGALAGQMRGMVAGSLGVVRLEKLDFPLSAAPRAASPEVQGFLDAQTPADRQKLELFLRRAAELAPAQAAMPPSRAPGAPEGRSQIQILEAARQAIAPAAAEDLNTAGGLDRVAARYFQIMDNARAGASAPEESAVTVEPKLYPEEPEMLGRVMTIGSGKYEFQGKGQIDWFYPVFPSRGRVKKKPESPTKLHVITLDPADLGRLQAALVPFLMRDPDVADFKTMDPLIGVGEFEDGRVPPLGRGQGAKGFTIYAADIESLSRLRARLSDLIAAAGLGLSRPADTGISDSLDRTYRVGAARESFYPGVLGADKEGFIIDPVVARLLSAEFRKALKVPDSQAVFSGIQLAEIEKRIGLRPGTLAYGRPVSKEHRSTERENNKIQKSSRLMLLRTPAEDPFDEGKPDYAKESGAGNTFGDLSDRPALYALSERYGLDQLDLARGGILVSKSLKPGESILIGRNDLGVRANSAALKHARVGRLPAGDWYLEQAADEERGSTMVRAPGEHWRRLKTGERVLLSGGLEVSLGGLWPLRLIDAGRPEGFGGASAPARP